MKKYLVLIYSFRVFVAVLSNTIPSSIHARNLETVALKSIMPENIANIEKINHSSSETKTSNLNSSLTLNSTPLKLPEKGKSLTL